MNADRSNYKKVHKKRQRAQPVKKWSQLENRQILRYVQKHTDFEKPTAQIYYKKLLAATKIDATWDLIKYKMRYFKQRFQKAEEWRKFECGVQDEETLKNLRYRISKTCPYYDDLIEIFGEKNEISGTESPQPESSILSVKEEILSDVSAPSSPAGSEASVSIISRTESLTTAPLPPTQPFETKLVAAPPMPSLTHRTSQPGLHPVVSLKKRGRTSAVDELIYMEKERENYRDKKLQQQKKEFEAHLALEEQKLQFERDKFTIEHDLRLKKLRLDETKLKQDFELKKLELEQKERIAIHELDVKYKSEI